MGSLSPLNPIEKVVGEYQGTPRGTRGVPWVLVGSGCWLGLRSPSAAPPAAENGLWVPRGGCGRNLDPGGGLEAPKPKRGS